ncbi:MAG: DUF551 domain-containing protein [Leclercia sp.]
MSTITKEWLQQKIANMETTRDEIPFGLDEDDSNTLAAMRIALASLEAEPVAYSLIFRNMDGVLNDYVNANTTFSTIEKAQAYGRGGNYVRQNDGSMKWVSNPSLDPVVVPLFTAPQAPVSVPTFDEWLEIRGNKPLGWVKDAMRESYDACRAAMLQSDSGNSPVIPDGWVACSERMPENDDFVYIWPRPDFGVELHVAQYGKFDKRDAGWYAQVYEQYGIEFHPITVTHWTPLPAAPQQEVK